MCQPCEASDPLTDEKKMPNISSCACLKFHPNQPDGVTKAKRLLLGSDLEHEICPLLLLRDITESFINMKKTSSFLTMYFFL